MHVLTNIQYIYNLCHHWRLAVNDKNSTIATMIHDYVFLLLARPLAHSLSFVRTSDGSPLAFSSEANGMDGSMGG